MPTAQKAALVAEIKDKMTGSSAVVMADYRGLTVKEMQALRTKLREVGGEVFVFKNSLTEIALRELAFPDLGDLLVGPTAFVFTDADPVAPAKVLVDFAKEHKALEVKGGFIERAVVGAEGIKALAALPSREELLAKLLRTLNNPASGLVRVLNGPAAAFARVVRAIADQKAA
ncbi:MAG: 50S ribosomal protein L10 [Coriobacteriia bacterium]